MVDMTQRDVRDRDVLHPSLVHLLEGEAAAPHTGAVGDGDIAIAVIVCLHRGRGCQYLRTSHKVQIYIALQPDATAEISTCRKHHLPAAYSRRSLYRLVDSWIVERHSVAFGSKITHVIHS